VAQAVVSALQVQSPEFKGRKKEKKKYRLSFALFANQVRVRTLMMPKLLYLLMDCLDLNSILNYFNNRMTGKNQY
jgi:hypothetical protein